MSASAVLVVNAGSSSVKLAVVDPESGRRALTGLAERLGTPQASASVSREWGSAPIELEGRDHRAAVAGLLAAMTYQERQSLVAVGHRVVHGGPAYSASVVVDGSVRAELDAIAPLAPLHLPGAIEGIEAVTALLPGLPQVAVFDTAFHQTMPPKAYRYAVPQDWYDDLGIRRYGFHGTSHRYVAAEAARLMGRTPAEVRLVSVHLGNGCSAAAVRDGVSVDTTMGFTPLEGLVMGTRSGDVDPGVVSYVAEARGWTAAHVIDVLNTRSGLLGLSGSSNDMRTLIDAAERGDDRAALAVDVFCYRVAKAVAALAVPLGRLDAVVLTGGIGEHAAPVRASVLQQLGVLGLDVDVDANRDHGRGTGGRISLSRQPVALVVPTDEELVMARDAIALTT